MSNIQIRIDENLKVQAQEVAAALGMEVATAIRIFLCQMVRDRALPFTPTLTSSVQDMQKSDMGLSVAKFQNQNREEWLYNVVHTGLAALENEDFASEERVRDTFKQAGARVG